MFIEYPSITKGYKHWFINNYSILLNIPCAHVEVAFIESQSKGSLLTKNSISTKIQSQKRVTACCCVPWLSFRTASTNTFFVMSCSQLKVFLSLFGLSHRTCSLTTSLALDMQATPPNNSFNIITSMLAACISDGILVQWKAEASGLKTQLLVSPCICLTQSAPSQHKLGNILMRDNLDDLVGIRTNLLSPNPLHSCINLWQKFACMNPSSTRVMTLPPVSSSPCQHPSSDIPLVNFTLFMVLSPSKCNNGSLSSFFT